MASKRASGQSQSKSTAADVQALAQQENCNGLLPIVGIGASAGWLEAFIQLLRHLPTDTGMAFVLIQHLDPNDQSLLSSLLARTTQMPVTQVQDGMIVAPNQVYVIPPNAKMTLSGNALLLSSREKIHGKYMPVDVFFRSLAERGNRAIAVVLSGTDADGALGLAAIKEAGGITFAQDTTSSQFEGMPRRAVATGYVDFVLPPQAIAEELAKKGKQTQLEQENAQLKQELATTKEYLQSIIEDQEARNQSLQVASEEILSSNEELQSTNEELETAQEELQAMNEELNTVNEELGHRNLELNQINNDLQNLLNSINIPILMLSGDQRIRRFTSGAERNFNLIPTDVGRPFRDIQANISIPNLGQLIKEVIGTPTVKEQEVQDQEGYWYNLRIRPYKTTENRIDGAVIGLIDINSLKRSAVLQEEARDYAAAIVETVRQPLVVLDADLRIITANRCFYKTFQVSADGTEGQLIFQVSNGQWNIPSLRSLLEDILPSNTQFQDFEVTQVFDPFGPRTILLNARKILEDRDRQMILLGIEDITERQQAQEQILTSLREKEVLLREIHHRVKNNLQIISSLLSLQSNRIADPQASEGFEDSQNRVRAMSLVHEILYQSDNFAEINFAEYTQNLVANLFNSYTTHSDAISLRVDVQPDIAINTNKVVICGLIINELVTNALKYGFPEGRSGEIFVKLSATPGDLLTLTVGNNGESLPADFNLRNLQSMGLNLVMTLIQQLKGTLELESSDKTIFKITLAA